MFELDVRSDNDVPPHVVVKIMHGRQFNQQQQQSIDTYYRPTAVYEQCNIDTEKYPDARFTCNNVVGKFYKAYGESVACFRHSAVKNL